VSDLSYKPDGEVLKAFMRSDEFFRGLRGPVGSGKSVASCIEIFRRALQQKPSPDGIRKSRWAIIRNTNPQLKTTTIKTWLDWFPESKWGKFNWSPPFTHRICRDDIDAEFIFLALDRPEDVKKLLSLELTGVFINEAREIPKSIVDACTMRVGRYPSMKDGGPSWYGVIADTNAPDDDHWWPIMAGDTPIPEHLGREESIMLIKPAEWEFFTQPGGMIEKKDSEGTVVGYDLNKDAENQNNLTPDYYNKIIQGKSKDWINVYVLNKIGAITDGRPVYGDYDESVHLADEPIIPAPHVPIVVGMDFGLTPCAVFLQNLRGRWLVLHELVAQDMGAAKFAPLLRQEIARVFPGVDLSKFIIWGDPSGDYRAQSDETTPFQMLRAGGITARPAPTNDPVVRIGAVESVLTRMTDGQPSLLIDPSCVNLKRGFAGGYQYRRLQVSSGERYDDKPDKNKYSHIHDALQYALCGGGESRKLTIGQAPSKPRVARETFDVFDHRQKRKRSNFTFG
jgi:hypothetical protein